MMTYKLKDLYLVSGPGGACSAFVAALTYHWLADIQSVMKFEWYASAHGDHETAWVRNWNNIDWSAEQIFNMRTPVNSELPFVGRQHFPPDSELLMTQFPSHLSINTTFNECDIEVLGAFLFFKQEVWRFDVDKNDACYEPNVWNRYNLPIGKSSPHELTPDETRRCVEAIITHRVNILHDRPRFTASNELLPDNVLLEMSDILRNKDKFLTTISNAIERPITDYVVKSYDAYIDVNKKLIETKCPWIDYFK